MNIFQIRNEHKLYYYYQCTLDIRQLCICVISFSLHHFLFYLLYYFYLFHSFTPFFLYFIKPGISVDRKGRISLHKETCFYHGTTINSLILVLLHVPIGGFTLNLKNIFVQQLPNTSCC